MAKLEKITAQTKTLSMLSDFSITYPLRYSENDALPFHTRITTAKPSPHATQAADSTSARFAVGSWLPRCRSRSTVSNTTMTPRRMAHCMRSPCMRCPFESGYRVRRSLPPLPEGAARAPGLLLQEARPGGADRDDDVPSGGYSPSGAR